MAPEVLSDHDYDCRADVFSAGIIFYVLLLRHNPFQDKSYSKLVRKNKLGVVDLKSIDALELENKKQILQVLASMLSKDPKYRPAASEILKYELFNPSACNKSLSTVETESQVYKIRTSNQPKSLTSLNAFTNTSKCVFTVSDEHLDQRPESIDQKP